MLLEDVSRNGKFLKQRLRELAKEFPQLIREVRGKGFLLGIEFHFPEIFAPHSHFFVSTLASQGSLAAAVSSLLLNVEHVRLAITLNSNSTLRVEPPLVATREMILQFLEAVERTLANITRGGSLGMLGHLVSSSQQFSEVADSLDSVMPTESSQVMIVLNLPSSLGTLDKSLKHLSPTELKELSDKFSALLDPFPIFVSPLVKVVCLPRTSQSLEDTELESPQEEMIGMIETHSGNILGLGGDLANWWAKQKQMIDGWEICNEPKEVEDFPTDLKHLLSELSPKGFQWMNRNS